MRNLRRAALVLIAIGLATPAAAQQRRPAVDADLAYRQRTEERLSAIDRQTRYLTGQVERLQFQLRQSNQRIETLEAEITALRAAGVPAAADSAAPGADGSDTTTASRGVDPNQPAAPDQGGRGDTLPEGDAQDRYDAAYGMLGQGKFVEGEAAFRDFVGLYPDHKLTGNARYWIAETLYARQRYQDAATAFLEAWQSDQRGAKAPDNLLKLGMSLQRLEKKREACASFGKLLSDYRGASPRLRNAASRERSALGC